LATDCDYSPERAIATAERLLPHALQLLQRSIETETGHIERELLAAIVQ
jgi:hypothetical protein